MVFSLGSVQEGRLYSNNVETTLEGVKCKILTLAWLEATSSVFDWEGTKIKYTSHLF